MADKGIIFSAAMVRALLDGRKTQTRRLASFVTPQVATGLWHCRGNGGGMWNMDDAQVLELAHLYAPYAAGDRLYVREAWTVRGRYTDVVEVGYRASARESHTEFVEQWPIDKAVPGKGQWPLWPKYGPSIHMPRWASRLWLEVTDVRVQRLQDISADDAFDEGVKLTDKSCGSVYYFDEVEDYRDLWNSLHTAPGTTWVDNPWIVAVSFNVNRGNIDASLLGKV